MNKLPLSFYLRENVVTISKDLLGKCLFTQVEGKICGGMIVETEAYRGYDDKACHASMNRRTKRTEVMFHNGGVAYVYLCYGMHYLFNVITNKAGCADAVLIRAIEPLEGVEVMLERRNLNQVSPKLTAGPGVVSQALGINQSYYGLPLNGDMVWIEERGFHVNESQILASPRVGVGYAGEDALLPWRFRVKDSKWTSRTK
jgi:DNA-3-methyladenine glycosylase